MKQTTPKDSHSEVLNVEFERLKRLSGLGLDLNVVWKPNPEIALLGEVKDNIIFIYVVSKEMAIEILRHEFLDYCISQAIEPYRMITNKLIKLINEGMYKEKERIVEGLIRLLFERKVQL
jgi:hypothetical protein